MKSCRGGKIKRTPSLRRHRRNTSMGRMLQDVKCRMLLGIAQRLTRHVVSSTSRLGAYRRRIVLRVLEEGLAAVHIPLDYFDPTIVQQENGCSRQTILDGPVIWFEIRTNASNRTSTCASTTSSLEKCSAVHVPNGIKCLTADRKAYVGEPRELHGAHRVGVVSSSSWARKEELMEGILCSSLYMSATRCHGGDPWHGHVVSRWGRHPYRSAEARGVYSGTRSMRRKKEMIERSRRLPVAYGAARSGQRKTCTRTAFAPNVQRLQESMLHNSHRCIPDDIRASRARVHPATGPEAVCGMESHARDGLRPAQQTSDAEAIASETLGMVGFHRPQYARANRICAETSAHR